MTVMCGQTLSASISVLSNNDIYSYQEKHALLEAFAWQLLKTTFSYEFLLKQQAQMKQMLLLQNLMQVLACLLYTSDAADE